MLRRVHASVSGGRVATVEFVPNDDRVSPPVSLTMLANTAQGDAYTFRGLDQMFRGAGFGESTLHELEPTPFRLIPTKRD